MSSGSLNRPRSVGSGSISPNTTPTSQYISGVSARDGSLALAGHVRVRDVYLGNSADVKKTPEEEVSALFLTDPYIDRESLISAKGKRVAGTCEWIRDHESYKSWLDGDTNLLWIHGGPGKGKTMLSIFLTEDLETITQKKKDARLVFYFCSHQDEKRNTGVAVLRGLIYQIIEKRPELIQHVLPYFKTPERSQLILSSLEALWTVFRKLVLDAALGVMFCVLDGFDECDDDGVRVLVPKIIDLFSAGDSQPTPKLKMVIISRELPGLRGCVQVKLDPDNEERVASDIEKFISTRVEELSRIEGFNEHFHTTIYNNLLKRSEGTFLWVGFVVSELSQKRTRTEVLDTLQALPSGLPTIYGRMLLQIDFGRRRTSSAILRWVTMAARPLTLGELAYAVGVRSSALLTADHAIRDHITLCGPFFKIQEHKVHLVHQSVRDYLLRTEPDNNAVLEEFRIKPEEAHFEIARTSFECIANSSLNNAPLGLDDRSCLQESPLINYAALHWPEHAICCSTSVIKLFDLSKPFFSDEESGLRKNWWKTYTHVEPQPAVSPPPLLHIACQLGIVPWARAILGKKRLMPFFHNPTGKKDSLGLAALHWAARGGHEEVVQLLLGHGADVDARDGNGRTALHFAVLIGHQKVVWLLLEHGTDVNATDNEGMTVLRSAAWAGHDVVVRRLLDHGADTNATDGNGRTALRLAASRGHEEVVRLLLDHGADTNATDVNGWTVLHMPILQGHEGVVRLLLDHGADINAATGTSNGSTPLHLAASHSLEGVVRLLLDHGADVNATDGHGWTALHSAASFRYEGVVRLLLAHGVDMNVTNVDGWTVLHSAAAEGHDVVVRLLLDHGADINATSSNGWTALYMAVLKRYHVVVRLLLDHGADINTTYDSGWTALHSAASRGHDVVVRLLLDHGADTNATDSDGSTALHLAASHGHDVVVRLLLDHGADINATDGNGWTVLYMAGLNRHDAVVQLLLDSGADSNAKDSGKCTPLD